MQVGLFCLQHSKTFDISQALLRVTIAELSTLKQVRFFGPLCRIYEWTDRQTNVKAGRVGSGSAA